MPQSKQPHPPTPIRAGHQKPHKRYSTAVLLSVLVGELGIDRFYLGHVGLGLAKLFTFGGLGIWWAIDCVRMAQGKIHAADGSALVGFPQDKKPMMYTVIFAIVTSVLMVIGTVTLGVFGVLLYQKNPKLFIEMFVPTYDSSTDSKPTRDDRKKPEQRMSVDTAYRSVTIGMSKTDATKVMKQVSNENPYCSEGTDSTGTYEECQYYVGGRGNEEVIQVNYKNNIVDSKAKYRDNQYYTQGESL